MEAPCNSKSYQYEFIDPVPDICLCKKCSLVARRLIVTSCCGESFCHTCINNTQQDNQSCPVCEERSFTTLELKKYQRQINNLRVYCSLKKKGCGWSGPLEQLEAHLDPDQDNCQYVDTKCPFNCQQTIPKNKVEQHVAEECVRRDFTCKHCNFKATYEEVVGKHLAECSYVPLQCPNRCGVTCERDVMEDHMRMCRLEEVKCEFSGVGCEERPRREDQEEHTRQSTQTHIALTAAATVRTKEIVLKKLNEQEQNVEVKVDKKLQELKQHFLQKIDQLELNFQQHVGALEEKIHRQQQEIQTKYQKIEDLEQQLSLLKLKSNFKIENFKKQTQQWRSPTMTIFFQGYRNVVIVLDFSRKFRNGERAMEVNIYAVQGPFDEHLKWPVHAKVSYNLLNTRGEKLYDGKWTGHLTRPGQCSVIRTLICSEDAFAISKLTPKTHNDTLCFQVVNITLS